jgi:hypothetical protein
MGLTKSFKEKVRAVRVRSAVNLLLRRTGRVLSVAGLAAMLAILSERLLAATILMPITLVAFCTLACGLIIIPWLLKIPTPMQASVLLDERLGLKERFSTTLALAQSDDPFAQAARAESLEAINRAKLRGHFPIRLTRSWFYSAGVWIVAILLALYLPQKDLLGVSRQRQERSLKAQQLADAKEEVRKNMEPVRAAVQKLGDPNLSEELAKLDKITQMTDPQEIKREAIKALGDLSEKIKRMQEAPQAEVAENLKQTLKRLKGSTDPFSQEIRSALAKGDIAKAADILGRLQKQLSEGELSPEKQQELAKQLQELGNELKRLSEQQRQLEDELSKLGLNKDLAKLSPEQLKQALQDKGLSQEAIEKLLQKAAAGQATQARLGQLAKGMSGSAGADGMLQGESLGEAIDQLNAIENMEKQGVLLTSSQGELSRSAGSLGQGLSQGQGLSRGQEGGSPNPRGIGTETTSVRAPDSHDPTATKTTRTQGKIGEGPVVAGWYFKDTQVKGEARREFTEVVQAGRTGAAEAISENQIPRKHEQMIKQYFNQLEASGPKP